MTRHSLHDLVKHAHHLVSVLTSLRIESFPKTGEGLELAIEVDQPILTEYRADEFLVHKMVAQSLGDSFTYVIAHVPEFSGNGYLYFPLTFESAVGKRN
jgi:hypothetical protein